MKTFAVVKEVETERYFNGLDYAPLGDGRLIRALGEVDGQHYAVFVTCGAALEHRAKKEASEIGGFVVEVKSECWPASSDILKAIRAASQRSG